MKNLLKEVDACLFFSNGEIIEPNAFYLTGFRGLGFIIVKKKSLVIITHKGEEEVVKRLGVKYIIASDFKKEFLKIFKNCKKIGYGGEWLSAARLQRIKKILKCKFVDVSQQILSLRSVKNPYELSLIKKSCQITDSILEDFAKEFKNFNDEDEAKHFLKINTLLNDCELAFEPIVASGKKSVGIHFRDSTKWLKGFVVVDFGVKYKGYCSDVTRMFYRGKPSKKELELYKLVLEVQEECIKMVKPGLKTKDIEEYARKRLGKLSKNFVHSLSHGFGVEIHEKPSPDDVLKEGMVLTIEPGIYFDNRFGIRIEDDVLVTKKGCRVLSKVSKKLKTVNLYR